MSCAVIALLLFGLCGCDPYQSSGMWQPNGANAGNLAAMAARRQDLIVGRAGSLNDGRLSGDAVERVWQDRPRPLTGSASTTTSSGKGSN